MSNYRFADTIAGGASARGLPSEALSVDYTYLDNAVEGFTTLSVSGRESLSYEVTDGNYATGINGKRYIGKNTLERELTIEFQLIAPTPEEFLKRFHKIKAICLGASHQIRFADTPKAHYTGTLKSIGTPEKGCLSTVTEMIWYCADPYLVADEVTETKAALVDGVLTANVVNDGTAEVLPTYVVKNSGENGYLGIVHANGTFAMGAIDEADVKPYQRSELLIDGISGFTDYKGQLPERKDKACNGSLKTVTEDGATWLRLNAMGTGGTFLNGGCKRMKLPNDSNGEFGAKNFQLLFNAQFATWGLGQTETIDIILTDTEDKYLCAYEIQKLDRAGNQAYVRFLTLKDFQGQRRDEGFEARMDTTNALYMAGQDEILKQGDTLRFSYKRQYYSYAIPEIRDKKVGYVYIYFGQLAGVTASDRLVTRCRVQTNIIGVKNNVNAIYDIPNRYRPGSEIVIDTATDSIVIDGLPRNGELVTGSTFEPLPAGTSKVEFLTSSWCKNKPDIAVKFRKRWL